MLFLGGKNMLSCSKCGKNFPDNTKYCPGCGAEVWLYSDKNTSENINNSKFSDLDNVLNDFNNTVDTTFEFDDKDIKDNKIYAVLAYFGILVLIPILGAPNSKFARFHANQGLVLLICSIILNFISGIVSIIPTIGEVLGVFIPLGVFIIQIIGIINAANGRAKEVPIVGKYKILK